MTLFEGIKENSYLILGVFVEEAITRRLEALGFNEGTKIMIINKKKNGSMIIKVRGTRLALGKHISKAIEVKECTNE